MATAELKISERAQSGKGAARSLRRQGMIPAVVYGRGLSPASIVLTPKDLKTAISTEAGWNTLITLQGETEYAGKVVILKDLQVDPIRRDYMHADFQVIDLTQKVHVLVPVHTIGKSAGEKAGGSLQIIRKELEVVCLPNAIPGAIEVDVTALEIGDVFHAHDISLPAGVEMSHDVNFTVITCVGQKVEEAEEASAEAEEA
ncbi:50S ribosomal protein L25/general stress protein Ctc [Trichloromonas sp.]|uniref:50S ribosomal protein L25/general stress protein Ctc n=1 Tax=Trichloromonas sp. TaxID=3069249 RepID=UPI002A410398|nr:50S ribosomal protein L25/general stress protein Ctc [Trichloromonas sp.]